MSHVTSKPLMKEPSDAPATGVAVLRAQAKALSQTAVAYSTSEPELKRDSRAGSTPRHPEQSADEST